MLVIDETGFLKQGTASCGVGRQYTGSAGKITNCQIGVFAAYVSTRATPSSTGSSTCPRPGPTTRSAGRPPMCPRMISFATKPQLAVAMIERAIDAGVPFAWVAADSVYGVGEVEMALRRAWQGLRARCRRAAQFWSWDKPEPVSGTAEEIAAAPAGRRWVRFSAGAGTKGPRLLRLGLSGAGHDARRRRSMSLSIRACGRAAC